MDNKSSEEQTNSDPLFRKEVLEKKKVNYLGRAIIITPISFLLWSIGIFIIAIGLCLFLYFGKYTRRQEVHGILIPSKGVINIHADKSGIIVNRFVQQGDKISKGQLLYFVSTEQQTLYDKGVSAQQSELLEKQIELQKSRMQIFEKDVERYKTLLDQNFISQVEYQKANDSYLSAKLSLYEMEQRLQQIKGTSDYAIKSPCDGTVSVLIAAQGDRITEQKPLASIIPEGSELQGMLFVPTNSIGFVKQGQKVLLKYQAFPYQQFGLYESEINYIDRSVLSSEDVKVPINLNGPFYRVTVTLKQQSIPVYGKPQLLTAGMIFEASILSEECSLWQWILRPIYSLKGSLAV